MTTTEDSEKETSEKNDSTFLFRSTKQQRSPWTQNNFIFGQLLGKGSFGKIYAAMEKSSKFLLAIKQVSSKVIKDFKIEKTFEREVKIHSHLVHENIVRLYGMFYDRNHNPHILLEYCSGGNLMNKLKSCKNKRLDELEVCGYIYDISKGIKHFHDQNVIHRDLKPENLLLDFEGNVKICDFGCSVFARKHRRRSFKGTFDYLAPQLFEGEEYDKSVDLWCLGAICYELITGVTPFFNHSKILTQQNIIKAEFSFPKQLKISDLAKDFISRLLKKDPKKRMTIDEVLAHDWIVGNMSKFRNKKAKEVSVSKMEEKINFSPILGRSNTTATSKFTISSTNKTNNNKDSTVYFPFSSVGEEKENFSTQAVWSIDEDEEEELDKSKVNVYLSVKNHEFFNFGCLFPSKESPLMYNISLKETREYKDCKKTLDEIERSGMSRLRILEMNEFFNNLEETPCVERKKMVKVDKTLSFSSNYSMASPSPIGKTVRSPYYTPRSKEKERFYALSPYTKSVKRVEKNLDDSNINEEEINITGIEENDGENDITHAKLDPRKSLFQEEEDFDFGEENESITSPKNKSIIESKKLNEGKEKLGKEEELKKELEKFRRYSEVLAKENEELKEKISSLSLNGSGNVTK